MYLYGMPVVSSMRDGRIGMPCPVSMPYHLDQYFCPHSPLLLFANWLHPISLNILMVTHSWDKTVTCRYWRNILTNAGCLHQVSSAQHICRLEISHSWQHSVSWWVSHTCAPEICWRLCSFTVCGTALYWLFYSLSFSQELTSRTFYNYPPAVLFSWICHSIATYSLFQKECMPPHGR